MAKYIKQEMPDIQQTGEKTLQIGARRSCPYSSFTLHQRRTSETSIGILGKTWCHESSKLHGNDWTFPYSRYIGIARIPTGYDLRH